MAKVRKAVIPAAGKGTRQRPASAAVQKELFPLVDRDGVPKPIIQLIVEEAIESGIEDICIVTQPGGDGVFRDYFRKLGHKRIPSDPLHLSERLHYAEQAAPEGFGHAVYQAMEFVADDPFLLLLGDHVFISDVRERCARQLIDEFENLTPDAISAVAITEESLLHLFGVIKGRPVEGATGLYHAERIVEKPLIEIARAQLATPGLAAGNYLAHFGMHVFSPRIFESLEYLIRNDLRIGGEIQLTAAQEHLCQQSEAYLAAVVQGARYDAGIPFGLMETQMALALNGVHRAEIQRAIERITGRLNRAE